MNRSIVKSTGAVVGGFIAVFILSVMTDMILEKSGVLPPQDKPHLYKAWMLGIALLYRAVFTVIGGYITARLAPNNPLRHVYILAVLGTLFGLMGTIAMWETAKISGTWYPITLLIASPLCVVLGGRIYTAKNMSR